ncbi:MAG TPA: hypothetical protein VG308_10940 [Stellaceae bacterium]|jgi:hypothetical protein|nr:hypothetical protein [Stellaceae bacterium]
MKRRYATVLVATLFAVALSGAALAQSQPPAAPGAVNETPDQNVRASRQYQQLVCTNKAFRQHRIDKECGPLQGSQFYDSCVASFSCDKTPSDANWRNAPPSETIK